MSLPESGSWKVSTVLQPRIWTMNGGARLRRALISQPQESVRARRSLAPPGSWKAARIPESRIGAMSRCASQRPGPDRGSATRSLLGSWRLTKSGIQVGENSSLNISARPASSDVHWKPGNSFNRSEMSKCRCVIGVARGRHSSSTVCGHSLMIRCAKS